MERTDLASWKEFLVAIDKIKSEHGSYDVAGVSLYNQILYRGLSSAMDELETTLERFSSRQWTVRKYVELTLRSVPDIESYTAQDWNVPKWDDLWQHLDKLELDPMNRAIPMSPFWSYLRHHGFPSPLLDWTFSPYIAAYFAFEEPIPKNAMLDSGDDRVAVYAYVEMPRSTKVLSAAETRITCIRPHVAAMKQHLWQQSCYTICTKPDNGDHVFICHEDIFKRGGRRQDLLFKITMPRSERLEALSDLQEMNITRYSLFQTEEALMKTLAFETLEKSDYRHSLFEQQANGIG